MRARACPPADLSSEHTYWLVYIYQLLATVVQLPVFIDVPVSLHPSMVPCVSVFRRSGVLLSLPACHFWHWVGRSAQHTIRVASLPLLHLPLLASDLSPRGALVEEGRQEKKRRGRQGAGMGIVGGCQGYQGKTSVPLQ